MTIGIIYASKYGTTEESVRILEKNIRNNGYLVDVYNVKKDDLDTLNTKGYEMILIGGSIYMGKVQKSLRRFSERNEEMLLNGKLGLFLCCGSEADFEVQLVNNFSKKLIQHAVIKGYFGYGYKLESMNFIYRKMVKKVSNISSSQSEINHENILTFAKNSLEAIQ